ncbi:hypothetical protein FRC97_19225 [Paracidovorax citrulli]|uniref:hypothetical protein n=1 Tax=Paracidovorax citrulli TaxID=80869 RepID=UPI0002D68847|nr:hypothetical protein [Paracidovorax citrulli]UMT96943.1 hypothetical protein FRC97_19225 [Paracidovorax citrulli]
MTHTTTTAAAAAPKSEALRCAEWLEHIAQGGDVVTIEELARTAAAELRSLDALTTDGLVWAIHRWEDEVKHRPLINVHRRSLDGAWRQVVRYFGGSPETLLGPSHDELIAAPQAAEPALHPDDHAVDRFAAAMKSKLAAARAKGRGGWETAECTQDRLSHMLREHVEKGDPCDVANFCMFLWNRDEYIVGSAPSIQANAGPEQELPHEDALLEEMVGKAWNRFEAEMERLQKSTAVAVAPALLEGRAHLTYTLTAESGYEQTGEHHNITPEVFGAMIAALHSPSALADHAARYEWLRSRDLDAVQKGGVFAGKTPDNVVLNGADLDAAIDAAIAAQR